MVNQEAYNRRNKLIYEEYCNQWGEGLREEKIWENLHERYFLQPKTLENIVRKMRKLSQVNQIEISFDQENNENNEI
jgi:hypothetical protein